MILVHWNNAAVAVEICGYYVYAAVPVTTWTDSADSVEGVLGISLHWDKCVDVSVAMWLN